MNNNLVGKIILVIGIVEIFAGFIVGIEFGTSTDSYGVSTFHFQAALIWWIAGVISGMLLIGFSEAIRLLDNINNKLDKGYLPKGQNLGQINSNEQSNEYQNQEVFEDGEVKNPVSKLRLRQNYTKIIPKSNKKIIVNYLVGNGVAFDDLYYTPFENFIVLISKGQFNIVNINGKKPTFIKEKDWPIEIKEWYEKEYTFTD